MMKPSVIFMIDESWRKWCRYALEFVEHSNALLWKVVRWGYRWNNQYLAELDDWSKYLVAIMRWLL
jgi:hypothetical protein